MAKKTPVQVQEDLAQKPEWHVGDKVLWKGIALTIHAVNDRGHIIAISPTMMVTTDDPFEFNRP